MKSLCMVPQMGTIQSQGGKGGERGREVQRKDGKTDLYWFCANTSGTNETSESNVTVSKLDISEALSDTLQRSS